MSKFWIFTLGYVDIVKRVWAFIHTAYCFYFCFFGIFPEFERFTAVVASGESNVFGRFFHGGRIMAGDRLCYVQVGAFVFVHAYSIARFASLSIEQVCYFFNLTIRIVLVAFQGPEL